jgi:hypothetical protein
MVALDEGIVEADAAYQLHQLPRRRHKMCGEMEIEWRDYAEM